MTDGQENASPISIFDLQDQTAGREPSWGPGGSICHRLRPVMPTMNTLEQLAEPTGGQVREGTVETIRELYKILSTYF